MNRVVATFNLVTPMFMSGADQSKFELRAESFKGMLRFWWRALAYGRLGGALAKIHAEECRLFGSSDSGQGTFRLRVYESEADKGVQLEEKATFDCNGKPGLTYLGFGVMNYKGVLSRSCLLPPVKIKMKLSFREKPDQTIISALKLFGLLGGVGSRSRRGFGSLSMVKLEGVEWELPDNHEDYKNELNILIGSPANGLPSYTAFSDQTIITCVNTGDNATLLLNDIGVKMQMYRSWKKEKNFKINDHDSLLYNLKNGSPITNHPDRTVFGLPHNYFFSSITNGFNKPSVIPQTQTRRASPLMIHIHAFTDGSFIGVISILPAQFLPQNEKIYVSSTLVDADVDYKWLEKFVNGCSGPRWAKTDDLYFPAKQQVFPILLNKAGAHE